MTVARWWRQTTPFGDIVVVVGPVGVERITLPRPATRRRSLSVSHGWSGNPDNERTTAATGIETTGDIDELVNPPRRDRGVAGQIDDFFGGRRQVFELPVDLGVSALSDFQRHVLDTLRLEVPYGETVTYGELAVMAGRPGAARAVGTTMARNPVPFVIPCHRVVAANGIGGYGGGYGGTRRDGIALKRALLDLEASAPSTH